MNDELKGRAAIVTGGAGGIGRAVVTALADRGAIVTVLDLEPGPDGIQCDVCDEAAVLEAFHLAERRQGPCDILVNNAGIAVRGPAIEMAIADWQRVLNVNLTAAFLCARTAAAQMAERGGSIVNVASIMGLSGGIFKNAAYQASKGGMVNLTRALAVEWAPLGIRVNAVAPTYVETDLTRGLLADEVALQRVYEATPMRRLAMPEEVANAVVFLAGPGASMTTGHILAVDGGFLAV